MHGRISLSPYHMKIEVLTMDEVYVRKDVFDENMREILLAGLGQYLRFVTDGDMLKFFRVLYSERSTSPAVFSRQAPGVMGLPGKWD